MGSHASGIKCCSIYAYRHVLYLHVRRNQLCLLRNNLKFDLNAHEIHMHANEQIERYLTSLARLHCHPSELRKYEHQFTAK